MQSHDGGGSLACPKCGAGARCIDSRPVEDGKMIRRRRACTLESCGHRWTTFELELPEGFDRDELLHAAQAQKAIKDAFGRLRRGLEAMERELSTDAR